MHLPTAKLAHPTCRSVGKVVGSDEISAGTCCCTPELVGIWVGELYAMGETRSEDTSVPPSLRVHGLTSGPLWRQRGGGGA
jgi:hypothetical protein